MGSGMTGQNITWCKIARTIVDVVDLAQQQPEELLYLAFPARGHVIQEYLTYIALNHSSERKLRWCIFYFLLNLYLIDNNAVSWPHRMEFTTCFLDLSALMTPTLAGPQTSRAAAAILSQQLTLTRTPNFCFLFVSQPPGDYVDMNLPAFNMLLSSRTVAAEQKYLSNQKVRTGEGNPTQFSRIKV